MGPDTRHDMYQLASRRSFSVSNAKDFKFSRLDAKIFLFLTSPLFSSQVVQKTLEPQWNETHVIDCSHPDGEEENRVLQVNLDFEFSVEQKFI